MMYDDWETNHVCIAKGLSEEPAQFQIHETGLGSVAHTKLQLDSAGRIVIPAEMRAAMLVKPGDTVTAHVVDGEMRIVSPRSALRRFQAATRKWREQNPDIDPVAELIADRRAEALRDAEEADAWRAARGLPPLE